MVTWCLGHQLGSCSGALARPGEKHMVERIAPSAGGVDENLQIRARLSLTYEFGQPLGPQRKFACVFFLKIVAGQPCFHRRSS